MTESIISFYWPSALIVSLLFCAYFALEAPFLALKGGEEQNVVAGPTRTNTAASVTSIESDNSVLVCDKRPYQLCGAGRFKHPPTTIGPHYQNMPGHHQHHHDAPDALIVNNHCPRAERVMQQAKEDRNSGFRRDITFVVLYYEEPVFLSHQIETWLAWPSSLRDRFNFLIVDDGSRTGLRADALLAAQGADLDDHINLEVYYIEQNLCWNIAGARNLAVHMAKTEYIFVCDADTTMPRYQTATYLLELRTLSMELVDHNDTQQIHIHFDRIYERENLSRKPHPAVMLLSKTAYWMSGGCDEDGFFTSGWFRKRANWQENIEIVEVGDEMVERRVPPLRGLPQHPLCPSHFVNCDKMNDYKAGLSSVYGPKPTDQKEYWYLRERGNESWSNEFLRFSWHRAFMSNQTAV
mmetsp:Transcript_30464/g.66954  ORF Transcript_30464/g.66954 Transcript_30464/m.66954 type:complete len:409 (+) Transcript_30464:210-1436(+)